MKHARKFASLLLALVMVFAMSATAFAVDTTGSITIDNPQADQTYTAYKIFDVAYNEDKTAYSYTIAETSEWFNVVAEKGNDGTVTSKITGLTFVKASSEDTYVATKGDRFSAAGLADTLKENTNGKAGITLTVSDGKAAANNLALGYYFVTSTTGALCNLTTTDPDVTIHDKNDVPFEKTDDAGDVEIGQTVNYIITGKAPDTTGFATYTYQITDKMSDGLTFNNDVKVYIDGTQITENFTLKTGTDAGDKDFVLDIEVMKLSVGAKIEVKYSATVNENAVATIEKNHATLEYSNDPTDSAKTTTREDEEDVYSAKIVIDKYTSGDNAKKLAGAEFVLYKEAATDDAASKLYYKYTAATETEIAKVEWVSDINGATHVTTDEKGAASFSGLKDGDYYLEEIKAPAGYNLLDAPVKVTINGANAMAENVSSLTVTKGVENKTGSLLPSTGGMGTTIFYVAGSILLAGAAVLLIVKKRMGAEK